MGIEHSTGSLDVPDKLETHPVQMEKVPEEQPAKKTSSDTGDEMVKACCDQGSASQIVIQQQQEADGSSLLAEETGAQVLQAEGCKLLPLSQNASSDKGQPIGQPRELDIESPPVEHNSEKADCITPQILLEAAGELGAGARVIFLPGKGQSTDVEVQKPAENIPCLADSTVQKRPAEISTCSPLEKEQGSQAQRELDDNSFEMVAEDHPGLALSEMAEGHSNRKTALVTEHPEAQSSSAAEVFRVEIALLPITEAQAGQNEGCSVLEAQTAEIAEDQTASGTPKEAEGESTLAQKALAALLKKPLASDEIEHTAAKFRDAIQNDGAHATTEVMSLVKERPASTTIPNTEDEPLVGSLTVSSPKVLQELAEAKKSSLVKELDEAIEAIELAEAQATSRDQHPQTVPIPCAEAKLSPVAQKAEPVVTTDVDAQVQGLSGAQKVSTGGLMRVRKQEAKFPKTFYFCCSPCNVGESEVNADTVKQ